MGGEILGGLIALIGASIGIAVLCLLIYRSFQLRSFGYSLPTIAAAFLAAVCLNAESSQSSTLLFSFFFGLTITVFALHAYAVRRFSTGTSKGDA